MNLSHRKKRPLDRTRGKQRDARLVIIATEGEFTEGQYFSIFKDNTKVHVVVLPTDDSKSSPEYVLERLEGYWLQYELVEDDELWLVIDVDRWGPAKLSRIAQLCFQKGFNLAVSNPCFELWLLLHHTDDLTNVSTCKKAAQKIRNLVGSYNKTALNLEHYVGKVEQAMLRAKALDMNQTERYPSDLGTRVYRLVARLL